MSWQLSIALMMVACAAGYLLRRAWRTWRAAGKGCNKGCGCAPKQAENAGAVIVPLESVRLRSREH